MDLIKRLISPFIPRFWKTGSSTVYGQTLFNYRRFLFTSLTLRGAVSIIPMAILLLFTYIIQNRAIKNENYLSTVSMTAKTRRTIAYFLEERLDTLKFITREKDLRAISDRAELSQILQNLKMGFGGYTDIGYLDESGVQILYVGPYDLEGKDYSNQEWFNKCLKHGSYVSDVFLGFRKIPHMIVAVKSPIKNGAFYILRVTLDISDFIQIFSTLELSEKSDIFLINRQGLLQTPSKYYGEILGKLALTVPEYSVHSQALETRDMSGSTVFLGYAFIENSPYILMLVRKSEEIMKGWNRIRQEINWVFGASVLVTLIFVLGISVFMVNRIYDADQKRLKAMESLERSSRLISVGRLAAGVAHEINNPLAIINESAGLIKDKFTIKMEYKEDRRLIELVDDVLESVERCGEITKQLLGFARQFDPKIEPLRLTRILSQVLSFFRKEAAYRSIIVNKDIPDDLPMIYSDRGSLQQVFFNLINNALQAMPEEKGRLDVTALKKDDETVAVTIKDNGKGISEEDQKRIFEPFFTTKILEGGTGLGLAITYGIVKRLRGDISFYSKEGEGTEFTITLPTKLERVNQNENSAS